MGPLNVPGFALDDCTNSFYAGPGDVITCTTYLADRFDNVLGRATMADFRSEAGAAGPPVFTKDYDPARTGDQTADLGFAVNSVLVTGYPLPRDVTPLAGELGTTYDSGCGSTEHNPRDGLGTIVVAVQGEEGFVDLNGNGVYDAGEPFIDQGEPFVDVNDDGVRNGDEPFIDVNQNGVWDGPNGQWDADAVVWAEARVLYTGLPRSIRWLATTDAGLLPGPTPSVTFSVNSSTPGPATSQMFDVYFADQNYNPMTASTTFGVTPMVGNVSAKYLLEPSLIDNLGMSFTQQFCDAAPPAVPTACSSTCQTSPRYRVTRVGGYHYGNLATALITGATTGPDSVRATATIQGIVAEGWIAGACN